MPTPPLRLPDTPTLAALAQADGWFRSLPAALQAQLLALARPRRLGPGQRLFARGDPPDGLYGLLQGSLRITGLAEDGQEALLALVPAPQWLGEIALFDQAPRTHDAWGETEALLLHLPQAELLALLHAEPAHWQQVGRLLTQKVRALFTSLEDRVLLSPTQQVARRLALMAEGYGARQGQTERVLQVSQAQLAQMLGLSRQTVNQALKALEAAGQIRCGRGQLLVLDLAALQAPGGTAAGQHGAARARAPC